MPNTTKAAKKQIINRMKYLNGHLFGIIRMMQENKYCIDILLQNQAVIEALNKVNQLILENHLEGCVMQAVEGKNKKERRKKIRELLRIFKTQKGRSNI